MTKELSIASELIEIKNLLLDIKNNQEQILNNQKIVQYCTSTRIEGKNKNQVKVTW